MSRMLLSVLVVFVINSTAQARFENYYLPSEVDALSNQIEDVESVVESISWDHLDPLGYSSGAKRALFGYIDLQEDEEGYFVKDVYCNIKIRTRVGPDTIPNNNTMNTEHTWPQSMGAGREPFRGDLHHLFPTLSRANSSRQNYPFGEVDGFAPFEGCEASKRGFIYDPDTGMSTSQRGYEPPDEHKGNVARALFYSAALYNKDISQLEEHYLRKWHEEDPVDFDEVYRNDLVEESQGNRNPFIDFPSLVDRIEDL